MGPIDCRRAGRVMRLLLMPLTLLGLCVLSAAPSVEAQTLYVVEKPGGVVTFTTRKPKAGTRYRIYSPHKARFSRLGRRSRRIPVLGRKLHPLVGRIARQQKLEPALVKAVIHVESAFNPRAKSHKGALGLMQLMPDTARRYGVKNAFNVEDNLKAGSKHLRTLLSRYNGNLTLALAAYNAGEGAVEKYSSVPPYRETVNYVKRVKETLEVYRCVDAGKRACG